MNIHEKAQKAETWRDNAFHALIALSATASVFVFFMITAPNAFAAKEVIEFPEEELAAESVLPVFDDPVSVKNRAVTTARRLELGLLGGQSMLEPFFNPFYFGLTGAYHFNEEHGINVISNFYLPGLSRNGEQLNNITGVNDPVNLQYAPKPKFLLLGNYQYTGFYGKLSLTKEFVMNLSIYGLGGLGLMAVGDSITPALNLGIGQKFYMTRNFALRVDLSLLSYFGPNVLSKPLANVTTEQSAASFDSKLLLSYMLSVGAVYILPEF